MRKRGGALLAVLWLSAALAAIAFSVALTVRGEITRSEATSEGVRAHYIALAAMEKSRFYMSLGSNLTQPDGRPRYWSPELTGYVFAFPGGQAQVEIIPESSKVNVNKAKPDELMQLLVVLGVDPGRAQQIAAAIVDWRTEAGGPTMMDGFYMGQTPSFRARHASLEEIEELLFVQGVTPDLFYGRWEKTPDGTMTAVSGLRDCLTVYPALTATPAFDLNTVAPPVMLMAGVPPQAVEMIVAHRRMTPFLKPQMEAAASMLGPAAARFTLGGGPFFTIRATGRAFVAEGRLSETRRSVSCIVRRNDPETNPPEPFTVMRWREPEVQEGHLFDLWPR